MQADWPRNFLVAAEYAHLLNAAGRGPEAIVAYRKVIAGCHSNAYSTCRLDVTGYGLGEALRGQRDFAGAADAYELAASNGKDPELSQKATLAAGEMFDVLQKRDTAMEKYRAVIAENSSTPSAELARRYMKQAYKSP
jgi:tetratricopeptide (TPR) repeat protein